MGEKSIAKKERNREIFEKWYSGMVLYATSNDFKERKTYKQLAEEYNLSIQAIRIICKREQKKYENKFKR